MTAWWLVDSTGVELCDICKTPIQRTPKGTLADGMAAHKRVVHSVRVVAPITQVGAS